MRRSFHHGYPIYYSPEGWKYEDNDKLIHTEKRPCKKCGCKMPEYGPDPCLGNLPGVDNACCGHGKQDQAYIRFSNGTIIKEFKKETIEGNKVAIDKEIEILKRELQGLTNQEKHNLLSCAHKSILIRWITTNITRRPK